MATGTVASPPPQNSPENRAPQNQGAQSQVRCDDFIEQKLGHTQRQVKFVDVVSGVMILVAGTLFFLLAAALLESWVAGKGLGFTVRLGLWLAWLGAAGLYAWRYVLPPLVRRINPIYAARILEGEGTAIEHGSPSLKNSLINFLLLRNHREEVVPVVFRAMEQRAARDLSRVEIETAVDRGRLVRMAYVLAGAVAVFALYLAVSPKNPLVSAARVLWPWSSLAAPTRVHIDEVRPGDTIAYRGEKLEVSADVSGLRSGEDAVLQFRTTDDGPVIMPGDQQIVMRRAGEGNRFQCVLPQGPEGLQQDMLYSVMAGDATTPPMKIEVHIPPLMTVDRIDYHYPSYTGRKDMSTSNLGDVKGIEGTRVTIHATANMDIKDANIDLNCSGLRNVRMQSHGCTATGEFTLGFLPGKPDEPLRQTIDTYQVLFTNEQGLKNHAPVRYRVEVERDLPPEIRILEPKDDDVVVAVDGDLNVRVRAQDPDFALRKVVVQTELQGRPLHIQSLVDLPAPKKPVQGAVVREWRFVPRDLGLKAGNIVKLWAEADDNKEPAANHVATAQKMIRIVAPGEAPAKRDKRKSGEGNEVAQNGPGKPGGTQGQGKPSGNGEQGSGQQGDNTNDSGQPGERGTPGGDRSPNGGNANPSSDANSTSGKGRDENGSSNSDNMAGDQQQKQRTDPVTQEPQAIQESLNDLAKSKKEQDQLASNQPRNSKQPSPDSSDKQNPSQKNDGSKNDSGNDNQQNPSQPQSKQQGGNQDNGTGNGNSAHNGPKKQPNKANSEQPNQDQQSPNSKDNPAKQGNSPQDPNGSGGQPKPQSNNGNQSGADGSQGGAQSGNPKNGNQKDGQQGNSKLGSQKSSNQSSGSNQGNGANSQQQQPGSNSAGQPSQAPSQGPGQGNQSGSNSQTANNAPNQPGQKQPNQNGTSNDPSADPNSQGNNGAGNDQASGSSSEKPGDSQGKQPGKSQSSGQGNKDDASPSGNAKQGDSQAGAKGSRSGDKLGDKSASDAASRSQARSGSQGGASGQKPDETTSSGQANAKDAGSGEQNSMKKPSGAPSKNDQLAQTGPKDSNGNKSGSRNGGNAKADGAKKPGMNDAQHGDKPAGQEAGGNQPKQDAGQSSEDNSGGGQEKNGAEQPGAQSRSGSSGAQQSKADQQPGKSAPSKGGSKAAASGDDKQGQQNPGKGGERSKQDSSGAPDPQVDKQAGSPDAGKSNPGHAKEGMDNKSNSAQSPGNGEKDGNQDTDQPGDRPNKKGGGAGGGGKSNDSGKGTAGTQSSAEDGGSPSPEKGHNDTGTKPGDAVNSNSDTGSSKKQETNSGGRETAQKSWQQKGSKNSPGGQSKPSGSTDNIQANNTSLQGGQSADGSPTQSGGGGAGQPAGGNNAPNQRATAGSQPGKDNGEDKANLEYSRKQLDLALDHLKDQMKKDKSPLLKDLGWSKDDAQRFIDNWRKRVAAAQQSGPQGTEAKHVLDESLRNLGLRPHGTQLKHGQTTTDAAQSVRDGGQMDPPPEYSEALREYNTATAGQ